MQIARRILAVAAIFALTVLNNANCQQPKVPLDTIDLHVILLEPKSMRSELFCSYLNDKRRERLDNFLRVAEGFGNGKVSMMKVGSIPYQETIDDSVDPFFCINSPANNVEEFAKQLVLSEPGGARYIMVAAALAGKRLGLSKPVEGETSGKLLRVMVLFADWYQRITPDVREFVGDGSDTCVSSASPTAKDVKQELSEAGIDLMLLITPDGRTKKTWDKDFSVRDRLLYPTPETADADAVDDQAFSYDPSADVVLTFVKKRVQEAAQEKFSAPADPESAREGGPTSTPTTTSSPPDETTVTQVEVEPQTPSEDTTETNKVDHTLGDPVHASEKPEPAQSTTSEPSRKEITVVQLQPDPHKPSEDPRPTIVLNEVDDGTGLTTYVTFETPTSEVPSDALGLPQVQFIWWIGMMLAAALV